jgi:hypothetical protein
MAKATVHTGSLTADEIAAAAEAEAEVVAEDDGQPAEATADAPTKRKYTRKNAGA